MGWVLLSSLANRWLWLLAVFAAAVLIATNQVPLWFAALSGVAVLGVGAGVDVAARVRRSRSGLDRGRESSAAVSPPSDPQAAALLYRATMAVRRLERARVRS